MHADEVLDLRRMTEHVDPGDGDLAGVGGAQTLENLDGGGLAGTVGTQHPEDLVALDGE